jgi:hypothetical protein
VVTAYSLYTNPLVQQRRARIGMMRCVTDRAQLLRSKHLWTLLNASNPLVVSGSAIIYVHWTCHRRGVV